MEDYHHYSHYSVAASSSSTSSSSSSSSSTSSSSSSRSNPNAMNSRLPATSSVFDSEGYHDIPRSMLAEGDAIKGLPGACLFIPAVSRQTTEEKLRWHFQNRYGPVLRTSIVWSRNPHAFVWFANINDANAALMDSGKQGLEGQVLHIERGRVNSTLFLAKVPKTVKNFELRQLGEEFGEVERVSLMTDTSTYDSRGCGFIKFRYREDAIVARNMIKERNNTWIVDWAKSTREEEKGDVDRCAVWVGGLDKNKITEEMLRQKFEKFGNLVFMNLMYPKEGEDKSAFAFLKYDDALSAAKAIETENNSEWLGKRIRVQHPDTEKVRIEKQKKKEERAWAQQSSPYYSPPHSDSGDLGTSTPPGYPAYPYPMPYPPYGYPPPSTYPPPGYPPPPYPYMYPPPYAPPPSDDSKHGESTSPSTASSSTPTKSPPAGAPPTYPPYPFPPYMYPPLPYPSPEGSSSGNSSSSSSGSASASASTTASATAPPPVYPPYYPGYWPPPPPYLHGQQSDDDKRGSRSGDDKGVDDGDGNKRKAQDDELDLNSEKKRLKC